MCLIVTTNIQTYTDENAGRKERKLYCMLNEVNKRETEGAER